MSGPWACSNLAIAVTSPYSLRIRLFMLDMARLTASWVTPSRQAPFGKYPRRMRWLFSTCAFCQAEQGSQWKTRVRGSPVRGLVSRAAGLENSGPLSAG